MFYSSSKNRISNAPGWKEENASESEADVYWFLFKVKADRAPDIEFDYEPDDELKSDEQSEKISSFDRPIDWEDIE